MCVCSVYSGCSVCVCSGCSGCVYVVGVVGAKERASGTLHGTIHYYFDFFEIVVLFVILTVLELTL